VILVVTGTNGAPFDRMLRSVDQLAGSEELIVQHGPSTIRPASARCVDYVSYGELVSLIKRARLVITHGGAGSILVALAEGRRPLVVPRLARYREAVDDHQLVLARRLTAEEMVTLVEDPKLLPQLIGTVDGTSPPVSPGHSPLVAELAAYVAAVLTGDPPSV
jgi:beta-1,4-N-acetylglucosaminyltransferase